MANLIAANYDDGTNQILDSSINSSRHAVEHDRLGARMGSSVVTYNTSGQVATHDSWTVTYDSNGRVSSQTNGTITQTFNYNSSGQFTGITEA